MALVTRRSEPYFSRATLRSCVTLPAGGKNILVYADHQESEIGPPAPQTANTCPREHTLFVFVVCWLAVLVRVGIGQHERLGRLFTRKDPQLAE